MDKNPESDINVAYGVGMTLAASELVAVPAVGWLSDEGRRDWQSRIEQLEHQKAKIKNDLHGPMHNLAKVEAVDVNQKITMLEKHEPGQFGGFETAGAVGGIILASGVLAALVTYGVRKGIRRIHHDGYATA